MRSSFSRHKTPNLLDRRFLRCDQVWFTEKDRQGATQLYSLAEFRVNQRRFLSAAITSAASMGAVPILGHLARIVSDEAVSKRATPTRGACANLRRWTNVRVVRQSFLIICGGNKRNHATSKRSVLPTVKVKVYALSSESPTDVVAGTVRQGN